MSDVSSLKDTIVPKSDQLNAEQLFGGPITITVTEVHRGTDDQPVVVHYDGENGRPYKPCKSMRKVLIFAWGDDGREWAGRSMTLFNNPDVKFGGVKVGGIRISHLSHIDRDLALSLTATKGKKEPFLIKPLKATKPAKKEAPPGDSAPSEAEIKAAKVALMEKAAGGMAALQESWKTTAPTMRAAISPDGTCPAKLKEIAAEADSMVAVFEPIGAPEAPDESDMF